MTTHGGRSRTGVDAVEWCARAAELGAGEILLNFVIVIVGAMFIAGDPQPYRNAVVLLTPPTARATFRAPTQIIWSAAETTTWTPMPSS